MNYGMVAREGERERGRCRNRRRRRSRTRGYEGHVTFYVEVPDVEDALSRAESLGGFRLMGPETIMGQVELGLFRDPEEHVVGVVRSAS